MAATKAFLETEQGRARSGATRATDDCCLRNMHGVHRQPAWHCDVTEWAFRGHTAQGRSDLGETR